MYGAVDPYCVFGVKEPDADMLIDDDCLDRHGLQVFVTGIARLRACSYVYGIPVAIEDVEAGNVSDEDKKKVQDFVDRFNGRFDTPKIHLAISGDYSTNEEEPYTCLECEEEDEDS
ncbi:hypothetical protein P43SY_009696 [Pythium insidiosum]|uniref:Uncharacterized protein n=1 Tax=Pythium insidiosum TaxID=114742 RepID=A0AAD5Q4F0_PYTIN|nr:hypothetical protein P43SY_009696 [Pythium insidiosum]